MTAVQLQLRRGTTVENDAFTGATGEVTADMTLKQLRLHDGSTLGGTVIGTGGAGGGAPVDATYVTLTTNGTLTNERVLTAGTGIAFVDAGVGSTLTINFTTGILSGTATGSHVTNLISYAATGSDVTALQTPQYLALANASNLTNERVFTPGTGLQTVDGGANGAYTVNFNTGILANYLGTGDVRGPSSSTANGLVTYSGTSGKLLHSNGNWILTGSGFLEGPYLNVIEAGGFSLKDNAPQYSLQFNVIDLDTNRSLSIDVANGNRTLTITGDATISGTNSGDQTIVGGTGITVVTGGSTFTIHSTATGGGGAPVGASYLLLGTHGELSNERVFTPGTGLAAVDAGANGTYTVNLDTGILTGYATGSHVFNLTQPSYLSLATSTALANERVFTPGSGLTAVDGGANSTYTVNFDTGFITGNLTTGNFPGYITGGAGMVIPHYAHPFHAYSTSTTALAAGATQGLSLNNSSTILRAPLMSGEIMIITRIGTRINGGASVGTYTATGGIRRYPNLVGGSSTTDHGVCHVVSDANSNGQGITTGGTYFNPLSIMTGGDTVSYNLYLIAGVANPTTLGTTGHSVTVQGYIVNTGAGYRYP